VTPPGGDQLQAAADPLDGGAQGRPSEPASPTSSAKPGGHNPAQQHPQEPESSANDPTTSPRAPEQRSVPALTTIPLSQVTRHLNCADAEHQLRQEFSDDLDRQQFVHVVH